MVQIVSSTDTELFSTNDAMEAWRRSETNSLVIRKDFLFSVLHKGVLKQTALSFGKNVCSLCYVKMFWNKQPWHSEKIFILCVTWHFLAPSHSISCKGRDSVHETTTSKCRDSGHETITKTLTISGMTVLLCTFDLSVHQSTTKWCGQDPKEL